MTAENAAAAEPSDFEKAEAMARAKIFLDAFPELKRRGIRGSVVVENLARRNGEGETWLAALLAAIHDQTVNHPLAAAEARLRRGEAVPRKEMDAIARLFAKGDKDAALRASDGTVCVSESARDEYERRLAEKREQAAAAGIATTKSIAAECLARMRTRSNPALAGDREEKF